MPFAYLRKQREAEERQQARARRLGQAPAPSVGRTSPRKALKIALIAVLLAPVFVYLPWLHSALGPGSRLPDFWVRSSSDDAVPEPECWNVRGGEQFKFCEDIEHIPGAAKETVLISCDANRAGWNTVMGPLSNPVSRGELFTYEYATKAHNASNEDRSGKAVPVQLVDFPADETFHPLGLSVLPPSVGAGTRKLFVVNHRMHRSSIELFDLRETTSKSSEETTWAAHWLRSIVHPLATHTPNSIHALSEVSLVVTNDHLFARRPGPIDSHLVPLLRQLVSGDGDGDNGGALRWMVTKVARALSNRRLAAVLAQVETLLGLPFGWVAYVEFDAAVKADEAAGVRAKVLVRGVPFANGLALSPDRRTLVVAATTYPGVFMYDVLPASTFSRSKSTIDSGSRLRLNTKLHLPFRVDNLAFFRSASNSASDRFSGHLLLATGHPAPLKLIAMAANPSAPSPSWSLAISPYTAPGDAQGGGFGSLQTWEDTAAPLPAHHFVLSHNPAWVLRTLYQSNGQEYVSETGSLQLPSSASTFYHAYDDGVAGTMLVSGMYGGVLACTNVAA